MDDLVDLSPLEQELEALSAIYLDELKIHRSEDGKQIEEVELILHPATGNDTTKQFVRLNLIFQPSCQYPDEVPEIVIRNPRGLGEEEVASLVEDMRAKAVENAGEVMLYTLIEMAKEALTEGNIPHCPCVVCLEHFKEHDLFHRTACYHYFHNHCLHKYLEHSRDQIERDKKEAEEHRRLNPEDEKMEVLIVCPVCRTPMDEDSLSVFCYDMEEEEAEDFIIPPNIREQQKRMAELYEKQKAKGAIIDVEWERNKYLVNPEERVAVPVSTTENTLEETSTKDMDMEEFIRNEFGHINQVNDRSKVGASRKGNSGYDNWSRQKYERHHGEKYDRYRRDNLNRNREGGDLNSRYRGNPQNWRGRGGSFGRGSEYRRERGGGGTRGRGGFKREEERRDSEDDRMSRDGYGAGGRYSGASVNSRSGDVGYQNDRAQSRKDYPSEKKGYKYGHGHEQQQQHRQHEHHEQPRYPSGRGGGRRTGFNQQQDHDDRRGHGDGGRGRGGRGGGGTKLDQRGSGSGGGRMNAGRHGRLGDEEDEEERQREEKDLKNVEINQRWRELNFGCQVNDQGRKSGFCVIDDDDDGHDNNGDMTNCGGVTEYYDEERFRHNPNYDANLNAVASSDSEEDWGKESDPFTFERKKIRHEQFEEYSKYKAEQLNYYAQKVDKRAEKQNSIRSEQQRIQREQQMKRQRDLRAEVEQREHQASEAPKSLSVLEKFRLDQEMKQKEKRNASSQQSGENDKALHRVVQGAESANLLRRDNDDNESSSGKALSKDAEHYRKKAGQLPNRNKVEGIKWVGVRDHEDYGSESHDAASAVGGNNGNSVFEDSWRRREEKERQRQKRRGVKGKKSERLENVESLIDYNDGDGLPKNNHSGETMVGRRRGDRVKESETLSKNLNAHVENDICYNQGDIVKRQNFVSSNELTQVSSVTGNDSSSSQESRSHASNLQRKTKCKKPLDLRKKPHVDAGDNPNQLQASNLNGIENLVEKFPSLLEDSYTECSTQQKSGKKNVEILEPNGMLCMASKNDPNIEGFVIGTSDSKVVNGLSSELGNQTRVPNSKSFNTKSKFKPLDFRKGANKRV